MIKSVIFDYGGTLDTNARHWAHVLWDGFQTVKVPVTGAQFREAYVFGERALAKAPIINSDDDFYALLCKKVRQELLWLDFKEYFITTKSERLQLSQRIAAFCNSYVLQQLLQTRSVLEELQKRYRLVLVSNFYGNIETILRSYQLEYFSAIIESAVVGVRKPDPRIYQLGVDACCCKASEVCVVGDSFSKDILPASSVGCQTIWLKGKGWTDKEEDESIPNAVVTDLKDLLQYL